MRKYEMTFILAPTLEAEALQGEIEGVKKVVTAAGGDVTTEKEWGRRRLAYPLGGHSEGVYHVVRFSLADRKGLADLNRHFDLNENLLRYLVIRDEDTPKNLEDVGSESEEHDSRDRYGRDRDRDRGGYGRDRGPRSDRRPERKPAPEPEAKPAATEPAKAEAPAAAGGEES